jgi:predicted ATP-binding protein involved in virulence
MHVQRLRLRDFRGVSSLDLSFPRAVTVLVGANGSGKTTILEAIADMLWPIERHFLNEEKSSGPFEAEDISNEAYQTELELEALIYGQSCTWSAQLQRRGAGITDPAWDNSSLQNILRAFQTRLEVRSNLEIPIAVYYPTDRAVLDIPLRIRTRHAFHQFEAWEGALGEGETRFRLFFEWFRDREDIENERRVRGEADVDRQLQAVRTAVEALLPGYSNLRVQRIGLRMTLTNPLGIEVSADQLSDGEKGLLALAGDLARRLAIAGGDTEAKDVRAVVLIDEIELHLHPKWQRRAVPALSKAFPNCQFIITTHSPQVISELQPDRVYALRRTALGISMEQPHSTQGKDTNSLLQEIFGESPRPHWMELEINLVRQLIDQQKYDQARKTLDNIADKLGPNDLAVSALNWDLKDAELHDEKDPQKQE